MYSAPANTPIAPKSEGLRTFPRINQLAEKFEAIACGATGTPQNKYVPHQELLLHDDQLPAYADTLSRHMGIFYQHAVASIPYWFEHDCRLGLALSQYLLDKQEKTYCFSVGSAEGTFAAALAETGKGKINVLTNTPTRANVAQYYSISERLQLPYEQRPRMYLGSFYELNERKFAIDPGLRFFRKGFDAIYETLTFQMYSADRTDQIGRMKDLLAKNGVLILSEKLNQPDAADYQRREALKDTEFKLKYFGRKQVEEKQTSILNTMQQMQVTEPELARAARRHFRYAYVVWNSCNFYTVICSDSAIHLQQLIGRMGEPSIPSEFVFTDLPRPLTGFPHLDASFCA